MKILQVHNVFQGKTGEETVVREEKRILEQNGHHVIQFIKDNSEIETYTRFDKFKMLLSLTSSRRIEAELEALVIREKPDVCHVHNTFPLITPVVYKVCSNNNLPVIKTLHNYKLVCTNSLLFRKSEVCEECLNKSLYNSIKYKCYRNSYFATAVQAHVIQRHRDAGTWSDLVTRYVCLTEFQKQKVLSGGVPEGKAIVKPNFISRTTLKIENEGFFLFVGKIDVYKGLDDLLYLFENNRKSKFKLIGKADDPSLFNQFSNVEYLGVKDSGEVLDFMRRSKAVIFPSKYYEGMPMVILEAFSHKKAVISRDRGAMASMIFHEYNGLKYKDENELVQMVLQLENNDELAVDLGKNAYSEYENKYSEEQGYQNLINLYKEVIKDNCKY